MQWHNGTVAEAVAEAKRAKKLFLVYIEGNDDMSKTMTNTYNDPSIAAKFTSGNIVALKLVPNSVPYVQFCQIYPVLVIPSSFFINNGSPIEIITGSLTPEEYLKKLDYVFETYEKINDNKKTGNDYESSTSQSDEYPAAMPATSNSSSLSQPSTSKASSSDSTPSLDDKVKRAQALIEAQRQSKAVEEQEKEKNEEMARRNMGKAMQQADLSKKESEMREWAKNRAKEKEEERLAREKVKAMIAQDRAEQAARYQRVKESEEAERRRLQQKREEEERERAAREASMNSNDARLQFRLPDGSYSTHCFTADATLEEARIYVRDVVRPPFSNFSLCTTFPRRHFTEADYSETLRELQLAPSSVLLILPGQAVVRSNDNTNFFSGMFWFVLSPITSIWNYIRSFFISTASTSQPSSQRQNRNVQNPESANDKDPQAESDNRQSTVRRRESPFAKREGNIFRINNQSDDDENNTWNGNSTQQM